MAQYVIEVSHTPSECGQPLKEIVDRGMHVVDHAWFGCAVGVHSCWLQLEVDTEAEARGVLPPSMRGHARVVEVQKLTLDQIRELHP